MAFPRCTRKSSFFTIESRYAMAVRCHSRWSSSHRSTSVESFAAVLPSAVSVTAHSGREVCYPAAAARRVPAAATVGTLGEVLLGGRGGSQKLLGEVLLLLEELRREGEV